MPDDLATSPETPNAKASAGPPLWRTLVIEAALTASMVWAAWRGWLSWDVVGGWVATVVMTQAKPQGSAVETAVKAVVVALGRRKGAQ